MWIVSKSYEMVGNVAWGEKLKRYITPDTIRWISYVNKARDWPGAIGLKTGWVLEFKSWEQGRDAFQARSIGGAWFDEQFPADVFFETFARTSDFNAPIWITLTPIDPDPFLQERYDNPPADWAWFSLDLEDNRKSRGGYLDDSWVDAFIAQTPEEFKDVRIHGKFAGFQGAVFKSWRREVHVCPPFAGNVPPADGLVIRSIDFGFNNPFVCLWMYRDRDGVWTVYDEHYQPQKLLRDHAAVIHAQPTPRHLIARTWADPEDAQSRNELAALGIQTSSAKKAVMLGIEQVCKLLMVQGNGKPRLRVTENCKHTLREMATYRWETNNSDRRSAADAPAKVNDHTVDALRYGVYSEAVDGGHWIAPESVQEQSRGSVWIAPSRVSLNKAW